MLDSFSTAIHVYQLLYKHIHALYARCIVPMDVLSHFIVGLNYRIHIIPMNNCSAHMHTRTHTRTVASNL